MPLGLYISVPFCRAKCTFCNFASGVFPPALVERYIGYLERDLGRAGEIASALGGVFEDELDSVYLGGGTPTTLTPDQLRRIFAAVRGRFRVLPASEITVECAPGSLTPELIDTLAGCGINRVSLGVQSFVPEEARAVGRLHTPEIVRDEIARLRRAGIGEISVDLIAGLPHQDEASWRRSLAETVASGVAHVSVYMLEIDADSRLGRELIAGGARYHAHFVPDEDRTADLYLLACDELNAAGLAQYEISNFARGADENATATAGFPLHASRHNLKYWLRQPYMGFGLDAHSMLFTGNRPPRQTGERLPDCSPEDVCAWPAVRFATPDELDKLLSGSSNPANETPTNEKAFAGDPGFSTPANEKAFAGDPGFALETTLVDRQAALEECWFLGLRLNRGVELASLENSCGAEAAEKYRAPIAELVETGLLEVKQGFVRLSSRGRLLSNEVFSRFLLDHGKPTQAGRQSMHPKQ